MSLISDSQYIEYIEYLEHTCCARRSSANSASANCAPVAPKRVRNALQALNRPDEHPKHAHAGTGEPSSMSTGPLSTKSAFPHPHCGQVKPAPKNLDSRPAAGKRM